MKRFFNGDIAIGFCLGFCSLFLAMTVAAFAELPLTAERIGGLEYWLNRYQTLTAGLLAIAAAAVASALAWGQLKGLRIQSAAATREVILQRSKDVESRMRECTTLLRSITTGFTLHLYEIDDVDGSWDPCPVNPVWASEAAGQVSSVVEKLKQQQSLGQDDRAIDLARGEALSNSSLLEACLSRIYAPNLSADDLTDTQIAEMESDAVKAETDDLRPAVTKVEASARHLQKVFEENVDVLKRRIRRLDKIVIEDPEGFL